MKKLLLVLMACMALAIYGCSDDDDNITNDDNTVVKYIIPLDSLNQWFGLRTEYDAGGTPGSPTPYFFELESTTTIQNELWTVVPHTILMTPHYQNLYKNGPTGDVWVIFDYTTNPSEPRLWAKYPAAANDTYPSGPSLEDTVTVTHIDTSITVPLGTYSCHRYEISRHEGNDIYKDYYYLLPDTGFIKWETYYTPYQGTEYLKYSWELNTLTLN